MIRILNDSELRKITLKIFHIVELLWNSRLIILENSLAFFYSLCHHFTMKTEKRNENDDEITEAGNEHHQHYRRIRVW